MSGDGERVNETGADGVLLHPDQSHEIPLFAQTMQPVGAFSAACVGPLTELTEEARLPLRSATAHLQAVEIAYRFPVLCNTAPVGLRARGDWIVLVSGTPHDALFLTQAQLEQVALGASEWTELSNGETVFAPMIDLAGTGSPRPEIKPYLERTFTPWQFAPGVFQAYPYNAYISLLEAAGKRASRWSRQHEAGFEVVLGGDQRDSFPTNAAVVRPAFVDDHGGSREFVASVSFSDLVPEHRVVIHETLLHAIGVRAGEFLAVGPTNVRRTLIERILLPYRHVLCRVVSAQPGDVGYAVTRIDDSTLDLLGISSGDEVLVRGLPSEDDSAWPNVRVRALTNRAELAMSGVDLTSVAGRRDPLPPIPLDLIRRDEVNLHPGDVAVIRPSFRSLISGEINGLLLVIVLGLLGATASNNLLLASALAVVAAAIAIVIVTRKFR